MQRLSLTKWQLWAKLTYSIHREGGDPVSFAQMLSEYAQMLNCSAAELSQASGLSKSMLSRYFSGDRAPTSQGSSLRRLARGIALLSREKGAQALEEEEVYRRLSQTLSGIDLDYDSFVYNLNLLMTTLELGNSELARALNFDPSYISRILSGHRRPGDLPKFLDHVSRYIARRYTDPDSIERIAALMGCSREDVRHPELCAEAVNRFLGSVNPRRRDPMQGFLTVMDSFNLEEYIRAVRFEGAAENRPHSACQRPRTYRGLEGMKESELDFLRLTLLSRSWEDVFFYSEMPIEQASQDGEFVRKWMYAISMLLKKGLHLHIVHDVSRPFEEMLMGLEAWIPLYMTGQITPYYFQGRHSELFLHHLWLSGAAALSGEAVAGHCAEGRYLLTGNREDLYYYRGETDLLLKRALPLMQIYTASQREQFLRQRSLWAVQGERRMICSSIPLFCVAEETLSELLLRRTLPEQARQEILEYARECRKEAEALLSSARLELELPLLEREEYEKHPLCLSLSELFCSFDVACDYQEYRMLLEQAQAFQRKHTAMTLYLDERAAFRNVNITVIENKLAVVSKSKSPTIHFVIRHPRMVDALARFVPPVQMEEG